MPAFFDWSYLLLALTKLVTGLALRQFADFLPAWLAEYGGGVMWAMMVFWLVGFLLANPRSRSAFCCETVSR